MKFLTLRMKFSANFHSVYISLVFAIQVFSFSLYAQNPCASATPMSCGVQYSATLTSPGGSWTNYPGTGFSYPGSEKVWSITPTTTGSYTFTVSEGTQDADFFFMTTCGNTGTNLSGSYWSGTGASTTHTVTLTAGQTYYLIGDLYASNTTTNVTVSVACPPGGGTTTGGGTPPITSGVVPQTGNNAFTTCSMVLYDNGGNANYANNSSGYTVLRPGTVGERIIISGTYEVENTYDIIYIYNGEGVVAANLIGTYTNTGTFPTITSTAANGALTIRFTSDGSVVRSGFAINVSCTSTGGSTPPTVRTVPSSNNNTYTTCSMLLYDSGGPNGDYVNNANGYTVLRPATAGKVIQIDGTIASELGYDRIDVYDGVGVTGNLLGSFHGDVNIPTIISTASGGELTVHFSSDGSVVRTGFTVNVRCVDRGTSINAPIVPITGSTNLNLCEGQLFDSGWNISNTANNANGFAVVYPLAGGDFVTLNGTLSSESGFDSLVIYNGVGLTGQRLYQGSGQGLVVPNITSTHPSGALTVRFRSDGSSTYSGFALNVGCTGTPLNVLLKSTTFECLETNSLISWITAEERKVDYYILEGSRNGIDWLQLKEVHANANSSNQNSYTAAVPSIFNYYRLVEKNLDGIATVLKVMVNTCISAELTKTSVFPNPNGGQFNMRINNELKEETGKLVVLDMQGKQIYQEDILLAGGMNDLPINLNLVPGTYLIQVIRENQPIDKPIKFIVN